MSRLSFRPRPLDIHKKLPIVKSVKDFEDDDTPTSTRNSQLLRLAADAAIETEVPQTPTNKKLAPEIPTPQFVIVDTYERDYSRTFAQPNSYLRARGGFSNFELIAYLHSLLHILLLTPCFHHLQLGPSSESLWSMT